MTAPELPESGTPYAQGFHDGWTRCASAARLLDRRSPQEQVTPSNRLCLGIGLGAGIAIGALFATFWIWGAA